MGFFKKKRAPITNAAGVAAAAVTALFTNVLEGLVIQKEAGVVSVSSRLLLGRVLTARLPSIRFWDSMPSSMKYV